MNTIKHNLLRMTEFLFAFICFTVAIIPLIFLSLLLILCEFFRQFVWIYLCLKHKQSIKLLNSPDALFFITKQKTEAVSTFCVILQGKLSSEKIKKYVKRSWIDTNPCNNNIQHSKLYNKIAECLGYFYWLPEDNFSIDNHVQMVNYKPPESETEFLKIISSLHNQYFSQHISPWKIFLLPFSQNYLGFEDKPHYCMIIRFHHCLSDAYSGIRMFGQCLFDEKSIKYLQTKRKQKTSLVPKILTFSLALFYLPLVLVKCSLNSELNILHGPKQSGKRLIGFSPTLCLERIKRVGRLTGTTVNDVLISCITGALQQYFIMAGSRETELVHALIPIAVPTCSEKIEFENNSYSLIISLPMKTRTDLLKRLKLVHREMNRHKASYYHLSFKVLNTCLVNRLPLFLIHSAYSLTPCTIIITNIPICEAQVISKQGDVLKNCFVLPAHIADIAIAIAITSTNGQVQFGVSVDTAVIQHVKLNEYLLARCINEFEILEQSIKD